VVHDFVGSPKEVMELVELDLFISISAKAFASKALLQMVKAIPISHLIIESSSPYNILEKFHEGFSLVKSKFAKI
jgi:TatD DNase family protein